MGRASFMYHIVYTYVEVLHTFMFIFRMPLTCFMNFIICVVSGLGCSQSFSGGGDIFVESMIADYSEEEQRYQVSQCMSQTTNGVSG